MKCCNCERYVGVSRISYEVTVKKWFDDSKSRHVQTKVYCESCYETFKGFLI